MLEYAPKPERIRHIIARLQKVPLFLDQATTNLVVRPRRLDQGGHRGESGQHRPGGQGNPRAAFPTDLADAYARAARPALDAMRKFDKFLKNSLTQRNSHDWRLGSDLYARKFRYALESGVEADNTLPTAERDLPPVRARMLELALPLHRQICPGAQGSRRADRRRTARTT